MAETMSGGEAANYCGDELWFGVDMKVSERDHKYDVNWSRNSFGNKLSLSADLIYIKFVQNYSKTVRP